MKKKKRKKKKKSCQNLSNFLNCLLSELLIFAVVIIISFIFKVGFRISPVTTALHAGYFTCKANYRGTEDIYMVDITVRTKTSYVPPPHINNTMARRVLKGDAFSLVCSVMVDFNTVKKIYYIKLQKSC